MFYRLKYWVIRVRLFVEADSLPSPTRSRPALGPAWKGQPVRVLLSTPHLAEGIMEDLWKDFWIRETGTGQQVAQLHDRYIMMMMFHYAQVQLKFYWPTSTETFLLKIQLTAQKLGTTLLLIFKHIKSCPNTIIQCEHWDLCTEGTWLKCIRMCATNIIANRTVPFNLTYTWISSTCYFWNYSVFITYLCYCRSSKIGKT
jgi:hypothetical protein